MLVIDTGVIVAAADRSDSYHKRSVEGSLQVEPLQIQDWVRVKELVKKYGDLPLGGTDASVISIAERLEQTQIATLDRRHFTVVKPANGQAFELIPN